MARWQILEDRDIVCPGCAARNRRDARFCARCGHALDADATARLDDVEDVQDDVVDLAEGEKLASATLVVLRGPTAGSRLAVVEVVTSIGRATDSAVFLDDVTVSRKHAEIRRLGDRFLIRDVGSLNGTYVNGERVEEAQLSNGDDLQVGKFKLRFLLPGIVH
jgi:hypothetical protein